MQWKEVAHRKTKLRVKARKTLGSERKKGFSDWTRSSARMYETSVTRSAERALKISPLLCYMSAYARDGFPFRGARSRFIAFFTRAYLYTRCIAFVSISASAHCCIVYFHRTRSYKHLHFGEMKNLIIHYSCVTGP